jgi:hypothetical protein
MLQIDHRRCGGARPCDETPDGGKHIRSTIGAADESGLHVDDEKSSSRHGGM